MNRKKLFTIIFVGIFSLSCLSLCGFSLFKKKPKVVHNQNVEKISSSLDFTQKDLWCVTFQLVWNELSEKFVKGPVNFVGGNPPLADELNKKIYTSDILSEDSYYTTFGKISSSLKREIETNIEKKFKEKSDILNLINWNVEDSYLFYTMLKKNFNFLTAFDRFSASPFNSSSVNVKYFGINSNSDKRLKENVSVLFYNSQDDYAIKLNTKEKEDVILYRTDKEDTFVNYFDYVLKNSNFSNLNSKDEVKIPDISVDKTISYDELCGKKIDGTAYIISQALQTIKFKMDNKGGSLKSEAAIAIMKTALMPEVETPRYFYFDKPFVLFLMEQGKDKPYYAMKINDTSFLVKE